MIYQRVRLWSGIVSIGANLGAIVAIYLTSAWWGAWFTSPAAIIPVLWAIPVFLTFANLPFEILSGQAAESLAGRTTQSLANWMVDWIGAALPIAGAQAVGLTFFFFANQLANPWKWVICVPLVLIASAYIAWRAGSGSKKFTIVPNAELKKFESALARCLSELGFESRPVVWIDNGDLESVNGCVSPGTRSVVLSTTVGEKLSAREAALLVARDLWLANQGFSPKASIIAVLWLTAGVALALGIPSANAIQGAIGGAAFVSLWCFAALFVWPPLNQSWMIKADRAMSDFSSPEEAEAVLKKIQILNSTDTNLPATKARIFHPIPPMQDRITSLP